MHMCVMIQIFTAYVCTSLFGGGRLLHHASLPPHPSPAPYQHQGKSIALLSWRFCSNVEYR